MKTIKFLYLLFAWTALLNAAECTPSFRFDGKKILLTEKEWKERLTPEQFYILREDGTEPAYQNEYHDNKMPGLYVCAACNLPLFSSKTKYDSRTGWPSFWEPICKDNVILKDDYTFFFIKRVEVECARCESHLGHVFDDGPAPTKKRYCINSLSLKFLPEEK